MEKYGFTKQNLYGENHHHITKIIDILQATDLEKLFIKKFYATTPMSNLSEEDYNIHCRLAKNAFNLIEENNSEPKINIYDDLNPDSQTSDHTIIEILTNEKPFVFDSIVCLLYRLNIEIELAVHPTIFVRRDNKGNITNIDDHLKENGSQELIVQILTGNRLDKNIIAQLKKDIQNILSLVRSAVDDWQIIVKQVKDYIIYFEKNLLLDDVPNHLEQKEFLEKMTDKYFIYQGSAEYLIIDDKLALKSESVLGIIKNDITEFDQIIQGSIFSEEFIKNNHKDAIVLGKLNKASLVHRDINLDYLVVKYYDQANKIERAIVFIGLFTSILYYQSATLIPIIRGKLDKILTYAGFNSSSYSGKELVSIVEALPRDELFQCGAEELYTLVMEVYSVLFKPELRLFIRAKANTLSCLLFLPTDFSNAENIRKIKAALAFEYGPIVNHSFAQINYTKVCYYHFIIDCKQSNIDLSNLAQVEEELKSISKPWDEKLNEVLVKEFGKIKARNIFLQFQEAFPSSYRDNNLFSSNIIDDIKSIILIAEKQGIVFKITPQIEGKSSRAALKIYFSNELDLSVIMPIFHNMGLEVISEQIHAISPSGKSNKIWLHHFILKADQQTNNLIMLAQNSIEEAFYAIWNKKCQNDSYNQLIITANINHRQVTLLRAMSCYLHQIKIGYSKEYIGRVLSKNAEIVRKIVDLFYYLFDPHIHEGERKQLISIVRDIIEKSLGLIHDNVEDQIFRKILNLVNNILRTNYFLSDDNGDFKEYISIKIDSNKIIAIPSPSPFREIFVYSTDFEAIHLRGGKVSRGGIRWSDRFEDYRTEVLGLMKTQVVKNSVIVPTGAKGGFVVKNTAGLSREQNLEKAVTCYQNFLRGLLDITDNIVSGRIVHPKNIIYYDEQDSYLVVAADKGTASFSDIANSISEEYNHWLGDAFASGGSKGYDHKKMGITAKGGWISVVRHFYELGLDIQKNDFTVVGIGDMSGDVFGNAMLLSNHIKLLAAFNHLHIFVDPKPDSTKSFAERQRLFNLPRSSWSDYNAEILSAGARIFERSAKNLSLTPEIKNLFSLQQDEITPDELIRVILTAEVDLLWNGGIGTYVKASFESHEQVGDKTNDNLRCNGVDLRCKVVGEGGNLGFTQYGRIEYAKKGGRLNTDAIDNSAGVDCSDHEVNIKIALKQAIYKNQIDEIKRISLLESMTSDVAEIVLKDNRTQTRALSIAEQQGYDILGSQEHFIDILEEQGVLDRKLECLPSKAQFIQLHSNKKGLTRPELSVLLAYSKNIIYQNLIESNLPNDPYFEKDLLLYFPEAMQKNFKEIIINHPLRKEIITTAITNSMVNRIDTFYLHLTLETTGHKFSDIARAYTITRDVFGLRDLWKEVNNLDGIVQVSEQVQLYIVIKKFVMAATSWLLRNYRGKINIGNAIEDYREKIQELYSIIEESLVGDFKANYQNRLKRFIEMHVPANLAEKIAILSPLSAAYNIVEVANKYKLGVKEVADIYFEIGNRFSFEWLRNSANLINTESNWQKMAIHGFKEELSAIHRRITSQAVESFDKHGSLEKWYKQNDKYIHLIDRFITEVKAQANIEYAMIDLSLKKLLLLAK